MAIMIIDNLPALTSPQSGDELPIERGSYAYKIDYNALASAIQASLTTYNVSEAVTLVGITPNVSQIRRVGNTVIYTLLGNVTTEIPSWTNGRIVLPEGYRPRGNTNVAAVYRTGSTVNVSQTIVRTDGNIHFSTAVPVGSLAITLTYVM